MADDTPKYWLSPVGEFDDFGKPIENVIYDAATIYGPWALMNPNSWEKHRRTKTLGMGFGQKYERQVDGRWLKVEG